MQDAASKQIYCGRERNGQANAAATTGANPHQHAIRVSSHCLSPGRNSRNTVVSRIRFPPDPNAASAVNVPSTYQLGEAPAQMAKMEHVKRDTLKANLRPITSAPVTRSQQSLISTSPCFAFFDPSRIFQIVGERLTQSPEQRSDEHPSVGSHGQASREGRLKLQSGLASRDGLEKQDQRVRRISKAVEEEQLQMHICPTDFVNGLLNEF